MVATSDWYKANRGFKAQIVTYTIAWLVSYLRRVRRAEISLETVWGVQTVSDELGEALQQIARQVAKKINDTPSTVKNVGEYCKQAACWNAVQPMEFKFRAVLPPEVRSVTRPSRIDAANDPVDIEDLRDRRAAEDDSLKDDRILSIRQLFNGSGVRSRDDIITELARLSGYSRTSARIREDMENTIRTAVRRGILVSNEDGLAIQAHTITEFDKEFLKEQFLASMRGRGWTERDDSIRMFARWLGYRRTGPWIEEAARSLINGLIRQSRLESDGTRIRRIG